MLFSLICYLSKTPAEIIGSKPELTIEGDLYLGTLSLLSLSLFKSLYYYFYEGEHSLMLNV